MDQGLKLNLTCLVLGDMSLTEFSQSNIRKDPQGEPGFGGSVFTEAPGLGLGLCSGSFLWTGKYRRIQAQAYL